MTCNGSATRAPGRGRSSSMRAAPLRLLVRLFVGFTSAFGFMLGVVAAIAMPCVFLATGEGDVVSGLIIVAGTAVVGGSSFGLLLTAFFGGWQILAVRRRGFPFTRERLTTIHRRRLTLEMPLAEAF